MRALIVVLVATALSNTPSSAQVVEVQNRIPGAQAVSAAEPVSFLERGLFDVHLNGQIESTAQILRINVGEPDGFYVPLYLFTGATSEVFGDGAEDEPTAASLVSPNGGFVNASVGGSVVLLSSASRITRLRVSLFGGGRLLSGREASGDMRVFGAGYLDGGLYFQTGAWVGDVGYVDGGMFWLQVKYAAALASDDAIQDVFGPTAENPHGVRGDAGILIGDKVNIKFGVFVPRSGKTLPSLDSSAWRIAFDYKVMG